MKKLLCAALALLLCTAALAEGVPGNRLGLETLAQLSDGRENQFVSPVSLAYALALAAEGAGGETLTQLLEALDADSTEQVAAMNEPLLEAGLRWANAVFTGDVALPTDYTNGIRERFGAEVFPLDNPDRVNAWAAEHTDGMIDHLMDELDSQIKLMLANAVVMQAKWASPFDETDTREDVFYAPDGEKTADFMRQTLWTGYGDDGAGTQFLRLDYRDGGLCLLLALPPEGEAEAALRALAERGLDYFQLDDTVEVELSLPRLDIQVTNSLSDALRALGLERPFTTEADFSRMGGGLMIDDVLQKVRVRMDEEETRAAAVTEIMMVEGAAPIFDDPPIVVMDVNHPFLMAIADDVTGAICFAGVVADPTAK